MDIPVTFKDVLANAKKAVAGGVAAAAAAVVPLGVTAYFNDYKIDAAETNALITAAVVAFGGAVALVYNVKNKPLKTSTKSESGEFAADPGAVPDASQDDSDLLGEPTEVEEEDTSEIEPVLTGDDGLDEPKHLAE